MTYCKKCGAMLQPGSALERADLRCHHVAGRVLQARVEIPLSLEVKELSHGLAGVVFERGRLDAPGGAVYGSGDARQP